MNCGGLFTDSPDSIKNKETAINPFNNKYTFLLHSNSRIES